MTERPLISVIVPVYRVEAMLDRCVNSLLRQSYDMLEIILVDDGSPDGCPALCDAWAEREERIKVIHKPNGGQADARNTGVRAARGEYICFVDSDDYISGDHIEYLLRLLRENSADIACGSFRYVYDGGERFENQPPESVEVYDNVEACYALIKTHEMPMATPWAKLLPTELVREHPFPVNHRHEDEAVTYKYFFERPRTVLGSREIYAYYQNHISVTHSRTRKNTEDTLSAFKEQCVYFEEKGCPRLRIAAAERIIGASVALAVIGDEAARDFLRSAELGEYLKMGVSAKTKLRYYGYRCLGVDLNQMYHKAIGR